MRCANRSLRSRRRSACPRSIRSRHLSKAAGLPPIPPTVSTCSGAARAYVDRILRGEKPGDLPVRQPTKYEFLVNLKTAKSLGLDLPDRLLALANEVIERTAARSSRCSAVLPRRRPKISPSGRLICLGHHWRA